MTIGPYGALSDGTVVQVNGWRGVIVKHERAENGVIVHTIKYTQRYQRQAGARRLDSGWKPLEKPIVRACNYSFITPLTYPNNP
jgi:hypothetical protein